MFMAANGKIAKKRHWKTWGEVSEEMEALWQNLPRIPQMLFMADKVFVVVLIPEIRNIISEYLGETCFICKRIKYDLGWRFRSFWIYCRFCEKDLCYKCWNELIFQTCCDLGS